MNKTNQKPQLRETKRGLIHIYTGNGKGKTTAAFGQALRAATAGLNVHVIQFLKGGTYCGDYKSQEQIKNLTVELFGKGSNTKPEYKDFEEDEKDRQRAINGLLQAKKIMEKKTNNVLILDEIFAALALNHLEKKEIMNLIKNKREETELILTGVNAPKELMDIADYVTIMNSYKHPFEKGILGRKGIDY